MWCITYVIEYTSSKSLISDWNVFETHLFNDCLLYILSLYDIATIAASLAGTITILPAE